jgi:allophanate hydrolase subunit 2
VNLVVEAVYGHASIQGAPTKGKRCFGVPPGGAFDPWIQRRLNARLGNPGEALVLELALCQITVVADDSSVLAWGGANQIVLVDGRPVPNRAGLCEIEPGSRIVFEVPTVGARNWVAVTGGFRSPVAVILKRGDKLEVAEGIATGLSRGSGLSPAQPRRGDLRAFPDRPEFKQLFENRYTVRHDSDRVGIRLEGPRMAHRLELPSEPATPGVVQITPDGLPIILGPDGPTIGGYPRAAVVISADVPELAQLRPGDEIGFAVSTPGEARDAAARLKEA